MLTDLTLFDISIRQNSSSEIATAIRAMIHKETPPDHKIALSVKWMVERNTESMYWLRQQKYGNLEA